MPFNCVIALGCYFYSATNSPTSRIIIQVTSTPMKMSPVVISLIIWIVFVLATDVILLRKVRGEGVEGTRVV